MPTILKPRWTWACAASPAPGADHLGIAGSCSYGGLPIPKRELLDKSVCGVVCVIELLVDVWLPEGAIGEISRHRRPYFGQTKPMDVFLRKSKGSIRDDISGA